MAQLIGLHGKKHSGKDTAYELLSERIPLVVRRDAFADRLKLSAIRSVMPSITMEEAYEICDDFKENGQITLSFTNENGLNNLSITGREFLQHYGTEAHRDVFGQNFWVNMVLPNLNDRVRFGRKDLEPWSVLLVTDVRFPNEAEAIHKAGGVVWQILRPDFDNVIDMHASEKALDSKYIDKVIVNHGTKEEFGDLLEEAWHALVVPTTYDGV